MPVDTQLEHNSSDDNQKAEIIESFDEQEKQEQSANDEQKEQELFAKEKTNSWFSWTPKTIPYLTGSVAAAAGYVGGIWSAPGAIVAGGVSIICVMCYSVLKTQEVHKKNQKLKEENQDLQQNIFKNSKKTPQPDNYFSYKNILTGINFTCIAAMATGTGLLANYTHEAQNNNKSNDTHLYVGSAFAAGSIILSAATHSYCNKHFRYDANTLDAEQTRLRNQELTNMIKLRNEANSSLHHMIQNTFAHILMLFEKDLSYIVKNIASISVNEDNRKHFSESLQINYDALLIIRKHNPTIIALGGKLNRNFVKQQQQYNQILQMINPLIAQDDNYEENGAGLERNLGSNP
jgi:hypothetical protein